MISKTTTGRFTVTNVAVQALAPSDRIREVRVFSDRVVHVSVGISATAHPDTAVPINAFCGEYFSVPAMSTVSVILALGETQGNIWVTEK